MRRARCVFTEAFDPDLGGSAVLQAPGTGFVPTFLQGVRQSCRGVLHAAAALLAPAECGACRLPLVEATRYPVCRQCLNQLEPSSFAGCRCCGEALTMEPARAAGLVRQDAVLCVACTRELPAFTVATSFGDYSGKLRTLIQLHKFGGVRALAQPLGVHLAEAMEQACASAAGPFVVIAVPLFRRKRAFNQSELLADGAMHVLGRRHPELHLRAAHGALRRIRKTESQLHLSPAQRRENVRGAFAVTGDVAGAQVLLVDDVYTTGATARECTRMLLRAGAASVRVATLARTQQRLAAVWVAAERSLPLGAKDARDEQEMDWKNA